MHFNAHIYQFVCDYIDFVFDINALEFLERLVISWMFLITGSNFTVGL